MHGARVYYAKQKKSERQIPYDFIHMWNLRSKTNEHMERGGGKKGERETNHKRLSRIENNLLRVDGGRWVGDVLDGRRVYRRALVMSTGCCM